VCCHVSCIIMSDVLSCAVCCHVSCVMCCHVLSCIIMCVVLSSIVSCRVSCVVMYCHVSCIIMCDVSSCLKAVVKSYVGVQTGALVVTAHSSTCYSAQVSIFKSTVLIIMLDVS